MEKIFTITFVLIFLFCTSGCGTKGYFINRRNDFADVFTCSVGVGLGAKTRFGPINIGLPAVSAKDKFGLKNGTLGPTNKNDDLWLLLFGWSYEDPPEKYDRGKSYYLCPVCPPDATIVFNGGAEQYTQLELLLALGPSIRVGFNPGELLDFALGWFLLDLYHDDYWKNYYSNSTIQ